MSGGKTQRVPNNTLLLVALILAVLSFQLNSTMVNPLLVVVSQHWQIDMGSVSSLMSVFFAASAVGGLVLARLSDSIGRRRSMLIVLGVIALGTMVCSVAPTFPVLILGRALQGLGAAVFPLTTMIIREYLPPRMFGPAVGLVSACNGGILGLDGVLAGYLSQHFGFQSVFYVLTALSLVSLGLIWVALPRREFCPKPMDWRTTLAPSVVAIAFFQVVALAAEGESGSLLVWIVVLLFGLVACGWLIRRGADTFVPWEIAKTRTFWPVPVVTFFCMAALVPLVTYSLIVFVQNQGTGFGLDPTTAALWFLMPYALGGMVAAPIGGWFGARIGWIAVLRVGLILGIIAAGVLAIGAQLFPLAIVATLLAGIAANGIAVASVNTLAVLQSPAVAPAALPALNSACFGIGISTGIALVSPQVAEGSASGFATAFFISGALAVVAFGATFLVKKANV